MSWSEALSAWDEQVAVLREVNEAYQAHLNGLLRGLSEGDLNDEGFGRIERVHELAVGRFPSAVRVRAWPTRPWGGEPGKLAVGISLDTALVEDEAFPSDIAALCKALGVKRGPVAHGRVLVKRGSVPWTAAARRTAWTAPGGEPWTRRPSWRRSSPSWVEARPTSGSAA